MDIIKLSAIHSTNDYLKELMSKQVVDNFTIIVSDSQTNGKGQMGSVWQSDFGKNLTFSILVKDLIVDFKQLYTLNIVVSLAVISVLEQYKIPSITVKWPNDIMSGNHKIGGILIENSFKSNGEVFSIVGIGLNVNQIKFENLPNASSLQLKTGVNYDLGAMLQELCLSIKQFVIKIDLQSDLIWNLYHQKLFKIGIPMAFENVKGEKFMGIIQHVSPNGLLNVLLENDSIVSFGIKEIKLLF
ncbi:biotin--[acetyl-CoA-carboxylase] ligase [Flavobacterium lacus]|jgi:BirA family transcriptional regulator, biotin operon repressor / biotin---[acetyl-CoA-carboxylase] ligase|uniref:BirA family biotin operon repressor/biotin-[acetyl-CoA-carboxylase] ligase n=1 Tax=Flavobacterium lacus TaxID=1353778 RepID=A0A328WX90_9FLAO|nr:biotin--[acetyl-CoA-carboxylase] ligase [Flavobacterium lacus]RAR50901.1 BirA family biotin operon repressor/biotin-[acetyl-CoA-carboxylase] ligase [Flavobacterium lacus]